MKNVAFVKMRDSVSFCKQILIEYVLRKKRMTGARVLYILEMVCACQTVAAGISRVFAHDYKSALR